MPLFCVWPADFNRVVWLNKKGGYLLGIGNLLLTQWRKWHPLPWPTLFVNSLLDRGGFSWAVSCTWQTAEGLKSMQILCMKPHLLWVHEFISHGKYRRQCFAVLLNFCLLHSFSFFTNFPESCVGSVIANILFRAKHSMEALTWTSFGFIY